MFIYHTFQRRQKQKFRDIPLRAGRLGTAAYAGITSLLILWLFRGFAEAVRSFIIDSTIRYYNPSEILPDGYAALMYLVIILLGVALLCVSTVVFSSGRILLSRFYLQNETAARIIHIGILVVCLPIFTFLDGTALFPLILSIVFIAICFMLMEVVTTWKKAGRDGLSQQWLLAAWMTLGSFAVGAPLVHMQLQQREHNAVEAVGTEFLRPSDSWLTYAVQDGIRTSTEQLANKVDSTTISTAKENNLAFVLWTKSLIGREGYSSALLVYNRQGNETDRFVVGMTKPEQESILSKVFAGEEDAVHVVDRMETSSLGKLYGAWTSIRDSSGQFLGTIAFLLSEHQKPIFHEEDTEPLRQLGERLDNNAVREIAVHEYINDSLVVSTGKKLYPERVLSADVEKEFQNTQRVFLWKDVTINDYNTQTLFMRDVNSPDRVAAISLEQLDFRWDMFGYLKEFFVCLALVGFLAMCFALRTGSWKKLPSLGFRGRLVLGFACITLVPLGILSYYNRQLVVERVQKQGETELYNELARLQNRIGAYVTDEEDFVKGVDDDFCEALAAEYGIDFSVYRGSIIQASSRSELYRASLLDGRLNGSVFASIQLEGKTQLLSREKIGSVEYLVGYAPLFIDGKIVGVLAIPTLNKQQDIEAEISRQNAYVFSVYAVLFGIALTAGGLLAVRFARPLQSLTRAAKIVADGNLDIRVPDKSRDEMGTLARSFNDMVSKLRASRDELAKHERETAWKEMAKQVAHENQKSADTHKAFHPACPSGV